MENAAAYIYNFKYEYTSNYIQVSAKFGCHNVFKVNRQRSEIFVMERCSKTKLSPSSQKNRCIKKNKEASKQASQQTNKQTNKTKQNKTQHNKKNN